MIRHLFLLLPAIVIASPAAAAPCDRLSSDRRAAAEKLFRSTYPYECCDESLDRCLKQKQVCRLARRLRDDICRRLLADQKEERIKKALERRARSMMPGKRASIDLSGLEPAGEKAARVVVVVYACARCPFCSKVVPELHRLATASGLKGQLAVYFKPFPISGHAGSLEGGLALQAAARLKRGWPFVNKLYGEFARWDVARLPDWAATVGLDRDAFRREMATPQTRQAVVEAKKEGLRNGVEATPTLFINGRRYQGELDGESLLDVLDEEVDRVRGRQFCDQDASPAKRR